MQKTTTYSLLAVFTLAGAGACAVSEARELTPAVAAAADAGRSAAPPAEAIATATDTLVSTRLPADGVAAPMREAMLSTKLMATVTEVFVQEGDLVRVGQLLARLDARDIAAKAEQVAASVSAAQAQQAQASAHLARIRALFADDAAPRAILDQAEAQSVQADAGFRAARAASAEVTAIGSYAEIRAPFAGRVTRRFVDPGAFAAPGSPLVAVQDASQLRLTVHVTPEAARLLRAGQQIAATIEGVSTTARVEGVVPSMGNLYAINAIVENKSGEFLAGSAAALELSGGSHRAVAIPFDAVTRTGDLTGVVVRTSAGDTRRWVRLGARLGELVEVTSGLRAGEQVLRRSTDGND